MRSKPSPTQRWRVSVYPPGVTASLPADFPLVHKASRKFETAVAHFKSFAAKVGDGKIGRVIMHQGKLYRGHNQCIFADTQWFDYQYPDSCLKNPLEKE